MEAEGTSHPAIAVFAPNKWEGPWMNRQQLFSRMAQRGWHICYSTGRLNLWDGVIPTLKDAHLLPSYEIINSVFVDKPSILQIESGRSQRWNALSMRSHARSLKKILAFGGDGRTITYLFHPLYESYIDALESEFLILHLYDALHAMPGWTTHKQAQLERCAKRADLIITSSDQMQDTLPRECLSRTITIENGADWKEFNQGQNKPKPPEIQGRKGPLIGCCGVMSQKTDIELLFKIASTKPEWTLVLVGPYFAGRNPKQDQMWAELTQKPNVIWTGLKRPQELPSYVGHMDANLIPYKVDDENAAWAKYCFPLKLHEYLATGKPVISSPLPSIEKFKDVISFAKQASEWIDRITNALTLDTAEMARKRISTAQQNSWDRKVDELSKALLQLTQRP